MKLGWSIMDNPDALWVWVLRTIYQCGPSTTPIVRRKGGDSNLWQGICGVWKKVKEGIRWIVRNGKDIWFCLDAWITRCNTLASYANVTVPAVKENFNMASYLNNMGEWDWPRLTSRLPECFILKIHCMMTPHEEFSSDRLSWSFSTNGLFSVRSAHKHLMRNYD